MRHTRETDAVYRALVSELAYTAVPTSVMGISLTTIGIFSVTQVWSPIIMLGTMLGGAATIAKVIAMAQHKRDNRLAGGKSNKVRMWERLHGLLTFCVAASVALISVSIFARNNTSLQILATALVFGYASGVASRISVRPLISATAITIAAVPTIIAAAMYGEAPHYILAAMFTVFLVAGMQSVLHVYKMSARHIEMRLEMEKIARIDFLTKLMNRFSFRESFEAMRPLSTDHVAIYCFDLDGFKDINDRLGHRAGDEVLIEIGRRLQSILTHGELAARLGGDEFVVAGFGIKDKSAPKRRAEEIVSALQTPYDVSGTSLLIGVSLGVCFCPSRDVNLDDIISLADAASYVAKRRGGGIEQA